MINFISKTVDVNTRGTLKGVMKNLPLMASNNAIEQLTERFRKRYEALSCTHHPGHLGNTAELSIPGGNVLQNNRFELLLTGFCCDHFQQHVRRLIEGQDQAQPGTPQSAE